MGLFRRSSKHARKPAVTGTAQTVPSILRDTIVAMSDRDDLTGTQKLQAVDVLRGIANSGFSEVQIKGVLMSASVDPKIREIVQDFLGKVGKQV